tara:strand:+ start:1049 stop:2047 length:999 start_codon:yes stop_codon:yes gene_type:complete
VNIKKNLIFRLDLDSGKYAGTGHLTRITKIYYFLKKKFPKINFVFLYKNLENSKSMLDAITKKNHFIFNKNFEKKLNFLNKDDVIICDTPFGIDNDLKKFITKKKISRVLLIDDLNKPKIDKCTIINGIIYFKKRIKPHKNNKIFQGPEYVFLDKVYAQKTNKSNQRNLTILVSSGGTDRKNNLFKIINCLKNISKIKILLIIGSQVKKNNKVFKLKDKKITFVMNKKNIYKYFCQSDLCLTAGGITMFESLALERPTLVYQAHNHQKYAINYFLKTKSIKLIGKYNKIYEKKIVKIISNYKLNNKISNLNSDINGKSYFRVVKIINNFIKK